MKLKVRGPTLALIMIHQDQWPGGIAGTQVAWNLIIQGRPTIKTMVSPRGYILVSEELRDERRVAPNHHYIPPHLEKSDVT
jgi:hypothetical protein